MERCKTVLVLFLIISFNAIGQQRVNMQDKGAVGDGQTLNTTVIQKAIDQMSANGGGTIVFPEGQFLTGSISIKSNVSLYLNKGAVILGSSNPKDYSKVDFFGRPETPKKDDNSQMALIVGHKIENVKIDGKGEINGQGLALALKIDSLHHAGIAIDPNYNTKRHRPNETMRPKLFRFSQSNAIEIKNIKVGSAACWGLSFELCSDLLLEDLDIVNRAYWNNDGIDITDCKNVKINRCSVDAADDGICLKSYYPNHYNENVSITNCTIRSSASAIKFGSASYGGFKNITIDSIQVFDTFRSAVAIESVDGAFIEKVTVSNVVAKNTGNAFFIRLGHRDGQKPGTIKDVVLKNIKVEVPFDRPDLAYDLRGPEVNFFHNPFPASIVGIPEASIVNIQLENIEISYPGRATKGMAYIPLSRFKDVPEEITSYPEFSMFGELPAYGLYVRHVNALSLNQITFTLQEQDFRPAFVFDDLDTLTLHNIIFLKKINAQVVMKDVAGVITDIPHNQLCDLNSTKAEEK